MFKLLRNCWKFPRASKTSTFYPLHYYYEDRIGVGIFHDNDYEGEDKKYLDHTATNPAIIVGSIPNHRSQQYRSHSKIRPHNHSKNLTYHPIRYYVINAEDFQTVLTQYIQCPIKTNEMIQFIEFDKLSPVEKSLFIHPHQPQRLKSNHELDNLEPTLLKNHPDQLKILNKIRWKRVNLKNNSINLGHGNEVLHTKLTDLIEFLRQDIQRFNFNLIGLGSLYWSTKMIKFVPRSIKRLLNELDRLEQLGNQVTDVDMHQSYQTIYHSLGRKLHPSWKRKKTSVNKYREYIERFQYIIRPTDVCKIHGLYPQINTNPMPSQAASPPTLALHPSAPPVE